MMTYQPLLAIGLILITLLVLGLWLKKQVFTAEKFKKLPLTLKLGLLIPILTFLPFSIYVHLSTYVEYKTLVEQGYFQKSDTQKTPKQPNSPHTSEEK